MQLGLNGATIMKSTIEDDIEIAAECGFTALEFWAAKLDRYAVTGSLVRLADRMAELRLRPACINSVEDITCRDAAGRAALLDELRLRVAMAAELRAPSIVVVPSCVDEPPPRAEAIADAVDVLRSMSDVAGEIALAFEFLGKPGCTVPTLDMAIEIADRVDRPNVGMVLDVFHFYAGGSDLDGIPGIPVDKLLMVHLNDAEHLPREHLTDAHRLYPGDGAIPLPSILSLLKRLGYDGFASVEIFRPQYWNEDPRDVARTALNRAAAVLAASGVPGSEPK